MVAGGCSDKHGSLDKTKPFLSISRAPAAKGGTVTVASVPKSDTPESFYLAINQSQLGQRYFLSAFMRDAFPNTLDNAAASSLGTLVVTFQVRNGKLMVFDAQDGRAASDTFDPTLNVTWRDHTWTLPAGTQVEDPLGTRIDLGAELVNGSPRQLTRSQSAGSGCGASDSSLTHDSRGNVTSKVDFNDVRSCHAYMSDRNVETYRVEGLGQADACPVDLAAYQVPGGLPADKPQRKISTTWHPLWKLEARRAEPKRFVTTVYNGEPDPLNNNVVAICASGDPRLPDNSRVAVICTRYEQSTDDDTGSLGFTAPVKETRVWNYTYNQYGQVVTETDPRGKVTTYEYWPAPTTFTGDGNAARGHWMGDLKKVTNALNQTTNYLEYNKRGQVLTTQYANGSQEQREYHVRGWLTKVTLVPAGSGLGQATQYDYFDTGLLRKVTQPDGSYASYTWDDAHRLTDVTDSVGNKVHYELDNAGNRTQEKFKDPQGALAKTIRRTFDALGRMSSVTGLQ